MERYKWGVQVGKPTKKHPSYDFALTSGNTGKWCKTITGAYSTVDAVYDTRAKARAAAKIWAEENPLWHFHARRYGDFLKFR